SLPEGHHPRDLDGAAGDTRLEREPRPQVGVLDEPGEHHLERGSWSVSTSYLCYGPAMSFDVIVRNARWFDGTGSAPQIRDVGIRNGTVAMVSVAPLDERGCRDVIDGTGKWLMPGFLDVHTHYDAEVLLDPGLRESVRHGVDD